MSAKSNRVSKPSWPQAQLKPVLISNHSPLTRLSCPKPIKNQSNHPRLSQQSKQPSSHSISIKTLVHLFQPLHQKNRLPRLREYPEEIRLTQRAKVRTTSPKCCRSSSSPFPWTPPSLHPLHTSTSSELRCARITSSTASANSATK